MADKPVHPKVRAKLTKRQVEDKRSTLTKQADKAIQMLADTLTGKATPTKAQMDACKLILAKTMPDLKSIEQTNKTETRKPDEIKAQLMQMVKDNPSILDMLTDKGPESTKQDNKITDQGTSIDISTKH